MSSATELHARRAITRLPLIEKTGIVIPTWNASSHWHDIERMLLRQRISPHQVLVIDSSSSDDTQTLAQNAGFRLRIIPNHLFRHGGTRQLAASLLPWAEVLVYMTQDACLSDENSLANLLKPFQNPMVGACYGRQLPRAGAGSIERHARLFNYPPGSAIRSFEDRKSLGIRAAFFSNSFAAYRRTAFEEVGGFPEDTIVSEEVTVAARLLIEGWKVAYQADATVIHSHDFTLRQEFSRYFDIGVHHGREHWLLDAFGQASGEGKAFILSEARFLLKSTPWTIPWAVVRSANKWISYHLGKLERYLPFAVKAAVSGQKAFWRQEGEKRMISRNDRPHPSTSPPRTNT